MSRALGIPVTDIDVVLSSMLMYSHSPERNRVDVVDLDPYGTAAPFIDAAVQCITDGGMLSPSNFTPSSLGQHRPLVCDMYRPLRTSDQQLSREMVGPALLCFLWYDI